MPKKAPSFVDQTTPSGLLIRYYDKAHRYKMGKTEDELEFYPSVTTVIGKAVPKDLSGWGQKIGIDLCAALADEGALPHSASPTFYEQCVALGRERQLLWWQQRDKAADRGVGAHDVFEGLSSGEVPDLGDVDPAWRGHAQAVFSFWTDHDPTPIESEILVGSLEHGYCGRLDAILEIDGKPVLVDLKTSKSGRYDSHHIQLDGYRTALRECGYVVPEEMWILRVGEDGEYEVVESPVDDGAFVITLQSHRMLQTLQAALKE
jgi:hypothetical protein